MVAPVLQRIINREIDIKTANAEMQAAQREARCKKHIVIVANQLRPNVIKSVDTTDFQSRGTLPEFEFDLGQVPRLLQHTNKGPSTWAVTSCIRSSTTKGRRKGL